MSALGIDFGGSRLRVAVAQAEGTQMVSHRRASLRMPLAPSGTVDSSGEATFELHSLKRALDFESEIRYSEKQLPPIERLVSILAELRRDLPRSVGESPGCVVAVPGCFAERQRSALREAFLRAGIRRLRLLDDAIAAIVASRDTLPPSGTLLVVSWGAVALSVSLFRMDGARMGAVAQEGEMRSGGDDIDATIASHVWRGFTDRVGGRHTLDAGLAKRVVVEAMRARESLAAGRGASVSFKELIGSRARSESIRDLPVAPDLFESALDQAFSRTLDMIGRVLAAARISRPDCTLAVGGMANHPRVVAGLEQRFGVVVRAHDDAVATGAAMNAWEVPEEEWKRVEEKLAARAPEPRRPAPARASARATPAARTRSAPATTRPLTRMLAERVRGVKQGRNDLCECGSGKKRKKCHGRGE